MKKIARLMALLFTATLCISLMTSPVLAEETTEGAGITETTGVSKNVASMTTSANASLIRNPSTTAFTNSDGKTDLETTWDCIWFGQYPQNGYTGEIVKPIKWRVLSVSGNDAFLIADRIIDCNYFNYLTEDNSWECTWETSYMRNWLNDDFLNTAFSSSEQDAIKTTTVINDNNPDYGTPGGYNTSDKVYLLSIAEAANPEYGFPEDGSVSSQTRRAGCTSYASVKKDQSFDMYWVGYTWLRSPGKSSDRAACCVFGSGYLDLEGRHVGSGIFVRPVLHLDLSSSSWSYAGTVNSDGYTVEYDSPLSKTGTFSFESALSKNCLSYPYNYDEKWFFNSNTSYQHGLSQMSIRAAMAAFGSEEGSKPDNIRALMEGEDSLGFKNTVYNYPTPGEDTIGYAIGSKNIMNSEGDRCSLLMVAIRGGGYKDEWAGNFAMGSSITEHDGFLTAANKVKNGIKRYLDEYKNNLDPNIKVWIVGYSRGAATANLTASILDREEVPEIKQKNVYAYCFECPQNTTSLAYSDSKYSNIFSIVNPIDFVPKVAMSKWGFRRYGTTYYLPSLETNYLYPKLSLEMKARYEAFVVSNAPSQQINYILRERAGQSSILDAMMNNLADIAKNRSWYYMDYQANLMSSMAGLFGDAPWDVGAMVSAINKIFPELAQKHPINTAAVVGLAGSGTLTRAHYPELCMFWLDSLSRDMVVNGSSKYKYWFNNCPTDVNIYNSNDELVASFVNDEPQEIENGLGAYIDDNGQKVVVLPPDGDYHFQISARDAGEMSYTLAEYDPNSNRYENVTSFTGIQIEKNDSFTGEVNNDSAGVPTTLTKDGEGELSPNITETGDNVNLWKVEVLYNESEGVVTGGGTFVNGSFSSHKAIPNKGYSFVEWYRDGIKVSEDPEYRFCVTKDETLFAVFEKKEVPEPISIKKATNPLKVKGKTVKLKVKTLKKKKQTVKRAKAIVFTRKGKGKLSYKLASVSKAKFKKFFKVNAKTGNITVKKGLKKGTYKVKVKVKAKGNTNYKASAWKKVTFKVKVK